MGLDILALWDFQQPELSRKRFEAALQGASADEALMLQTQIARTHGLQGDFARALEVLAAIEPRLETANPEVRVRHSLELGRCYSSATHPAESQTAEARERARSAYLRAHQLARAAGLDDLAIDALHMMTFVDTAPERQVEWNRKALALMQTSSQPSARKWEASLHNNLGYSLHLQGLHEDAQREFELALAAREREGRPQEVRVARWMIAWNLRALGRLDEAIKIQLQLEQECDEAGEPDAYVFEELEQLYRAFGNTQQAEHYSARRKAIGQ